MFGKTLGSLALALALLAAACSSSGSGAATATLRIYAGTVEVQSGTGGFVAGRDGQALGEGDVVRTGADGRAGIEYFDGSVTRLDFDTTFTITSLEILDNEATVIEGEQTTGNTFHRVVALTESASRFDVTTPTATVSVQGTTFAMLLLPDGSMVVAAVEDTVLVGGTPVGTGFMVTVDPAGNVGEPVPIPPGFLGEWIVFNCDVDDIPACDDLVAGPVSYVEIYPVEATINLGGSQAYTGAAFDGQGAPIPGVDEDDLVFAIAPSGACAGATCTPEQSGDHIVTATYGDGGPQASANLIVLGTGVVQVTLDWDGTADLDLYVTEPGGATISYLNPEAAGASLDRDANAACTESTLAPSENVFWETDAPQGEYSVMVDLWGACDDTPPIAFTLTIRLDGVVWAQFSGSVGAGEDQAFYSFTYPAT